MPKPSDTAMRMRYWAWMLSSKMSGVSPAKVGQGAITLTGNSRARRTLIESAWSYRFRARKTMHLKRKAADASEEAKVIAWTAQKRLCGRYYALTRAGKNTKLACVAIARELVGFVWDIVRQETPKLAAN